MATYETEIRVRFGDIDRAGIVYYPRISHYCHVALEEFFRDRVGIPYHEVIDGRRLGFPAVHLEADYRERLEFGERARVRIDILRIGRSSHVTRYRILREKTGNVCVETRITTACVDMETFRPVPLPDDIRAVLEAHLADEST